MANKDFKRWTNKEIDFLVDNYKRISLEEISEKLKRTKRGCYRKLQALGLFLRDIWEDEELIKLKELFPITTTRELVELFDRSERNIIYTATKLGLYKEASWSEEEKELVTSLRLDGMQVKDITSKLNGSKTHSAVLAFLQKRKISPLVENPSKYRNWSIEQLNYLLNNYENKSLEEIAKVLGRTVGSLYYILNEEGHEFEVNYWTKEETDQLIELYPKNSNIEIQKILSRSESAIVSKARLLGLKKNKYWDQEEIKILKEMVKDHLSRKRMAEVLDRNIDSIQHKLREQELTEECKRWTSKELEIISSLAKTGNFTFDEIAQAVDATYEQIYRVCYAHKLSSFVKKQTSYGNKKLITYLKELYPAYTIEVEYHIGERLRLDAYIKNLRLGCEYDGEQHFKFLPIFHQTQEEFLESQERDRRKEELCVQQGISLVRIKYNEKFTKELLKKKIDEVFIKDNRYNTEETIKDISPEKKSLIKPLKKDKPKVKYNWPSRKIQSRPFSPKAKT